MTTAYITDTRFAAHTLAGHVEYAGRLTVIQDLLDRHGLPGQTVKLSPAPATQQQLLTAHTQEYLELLAWTETQKGLQLGPDTYVLPQSFGVAKLACGAAIKGVDAVMAGQTGNALVCARPPGHHATSAMGMGFCLLGNVAIAARHARNAYGIKRVLIVDYDVHHGNGTQDILYDDPSVMFVSTHQYPWYPGTGAVNERGEGAGIGATVNIPLEAGVGDDGYAQVYEQIVWPVARRFEPELILVSAGFDAHWADPLGQMKLSLKGFDHLTRELVLMAETFCGGKIVFVLEGGYNLNSLSCGVLNVAHALLGKSDLTDPIGPAKGSEPSVTPLIAQIRRAHGLE
jgi:acetoin utilization deacetylase AcuC-like enzyme